MMTKVRQRHLERQKQKEMSKAVNRYLVTTFILQLIASLLVIWNSDFTLCLGGMAMLLLLELHLTKYIF